MKNILLFLLLVPVSYWAQIPAGYYNGTEGLSGYALKSKVHEIISKKIFSYNYSQIGPLYAYTDLDKYYENDNTVLDIYSEKPTEADAYNYDLTQNISSANAEGQGWNKEHGMPQSTFYGLYPMYSDMHYLIPADARINQLRSNYPYARNNGSSNIFTNGSKRGTSTTPGYTNLVYEPIDEFKGDVARFLLYFAVRYEGNLNLYNHQLSTMPLDGSEEKAFEDWYITMLKDWNNLDPVSQRERDRNNAVYAIQKMRNPFIDREEWVDLIWGETPDGIAPQAPSNVSVSQLGESFITLSWTPSTDTDILGYKVYLNGNYVKYSKTNSVSIDRLQPSTSYNVTIKAYDKGYLLSPDSNQVSATTLSTDNFAKDLMITKYIEGTTSSTTDVYNTAIEITNLTGHDVDLGNYYLNTEFKSTTYYFSDAYQLEGKIAHGESVVVINPKSNFSGIDINQFKFVTNAPPLTYTGSQYVELSYGIKTIKTVSTNNYEMLFETVDVVGAKGTSNTNGNKSLYRNTNVNDPNITFTLSEWTDYGLDYASGLGSFLSTTEPERVEFSYTVYPNPVSERLYVNGKNISKVSKVEVYDISGKLLQVIPQAFKIDNSIDVSTYSPGVYFISLDGVSYKFIKK
ncbi:endonuclease [Cloacibacterium sp. TD35]|uniref:endonuclease n=1 Tax=Cloacibacterium sp. TD35 TaxID=2976818 RepID=UPI00237E06E7|nr:endonuclease [Cloacibacterium sp. TD35]WDT67594.1 endonuclease [Cloacibacterium sp. TD35]